MFCRMTQISSTEPTVTAICDALGRKEISVRVKRTAAAVSNAASEGVFPAGWYLVIKEMCAEKGIGCPDGLFRFSPKTNEAA